MLVVELGEQLQVRPSGQIGIEGGLLDEPGDPAERHASAELQRLAEQLDRPPVRAHQAEQRPQQRRLSCAVRAEKAAQLAGSDLEVDAVEGKRVAVSFRQAAHPRRPGSGPRCHHGRSLTFR